MGGDVFTSAPRLWPDATVVILASGPSLVREDVEACAHLPTICVNDSWRLAPSAAVLYSSDQHWWAHYKGVPEFAGERWAIGRPKWYAGYPQIKLLKIGRKEGLSSSLDTLSTGCNSGYAAVNLAIHFGAKSIILLGFDLSWDGTKSHFFGKHPSKLSDHQGHFPYFRGAFGKLPRLLEPLGISIVNCSRRTTMPNVPRRPLADVLATVPRGASECAA